MKKYVLVAMLLFAGTAHAYRNQSFSAGLGYYSQNALGKTTTKENSAPTLFGATNIPLNLRYEYEMMNNLFLSPQLSYSLIDRGSAGGSAKTTMWHLVLPVGSNFGMGNMWDWSVGPGLINYTIKGAGGTTVMNNGTSTATFALPGDSSQASNVTFNLGAAFNFSVFRIGFDLVTEGLMSTKRTESFMLSFAYRTGGGL